MALYTKSGDIYETPEDIRISEADGTMVSAEAVRAKQSDSTWVDVWPEYEQAVRYLMLYDYGDECTAVTGGWTQYVKTTHAQAVEFYTAKAIDLSEYSVLIGNGKYATGNYGNVQIAYTSTPPALVTLITSSTGKANFTTLMNWVINDTHNVIKKKDISSIKVTTLCFGTFSDSDYFSHSISRNQDNLYVYIKANTLIFSGNLYALAAFKPDDWQTWLSKAGVSAASLDDVMSNSTLLTTLLSSWGATNYMLKQCTGEVMAAAIQSSAFLVALESSPYKSKVYANPHWAKFLAMV